MNYFYGPVPSRRLGFSLGVDLLNEKICSFDCIYCQVGRTVKKTIRRGSFINFEEFKKELEAIVLRECKIDYITFSGSGETTLHKGLDKIISAVKNITANKYPVCVITNSSLLYRKDVRDELRGADLVIPSLDAAKEDVFRKINRPYKNITFSKILKGIVSFRKEFKGAIWLEIMLIKGVNDSISDARNFRKIIEKINPDKVQLNLPVRPAPVKLELTALDKLEKIKKIIGFDAEILSSSSLRVQRKYYLK